jgi:hypothetical protein
MVIGRQQVTTDLGFSRRDETTRIEVSMRTTANPYSPPESRLRSNALGVKRFGRYAVCLMVLVIGLIALALGFAAMTFAIRAPEFQIHFALTATLLLCSGTMWIACSAVGIRRYTRSGFVLFFIGLAFFVSGMSVHIPL